MNIGTITIKLGNIEHATLLRYKEVLDILVDSGALNMKHGSVTLHFDKVGLLQSIEGNPQIWRRDALPSLTSRATITVTENPTSTKSGQA